MLKPYIIAFLLEALVISAFAQTDQDINIDNSFKDTNSYAILSISEFKIYALDSTYTPAKLTEKEIKVVEKLFFKAIEDYNANMSKFIDSTYKTSKERSEMKNDLLIPIYRIFYRKQLLPAFNKKGEKEVYIKCAAGRSSEDFWKYDLFQVMDGGNLYFTLRVNITQGTFYDTTIGGYG